MSQKISKKPKTDPAQDALSHSRDFLLGLSRAAQSVQQAHTTGEIYRAVGDQIKSLGCEVTLLLINEDRQSLTVVYVSYASNLVRQAEKLIGTSALNYRIVFSTDSVYARNIAAGKAEYVHSAKEHFIDALPKAIRPLISQLMSILKIEQGIFAPLHVEGETLGLMMVSGLELNEGDVPAMESFAGQIAAGLRNVRLMQKLQDELSARKQAEESLDHSRNLLLALSRAAQSVQQARTEKEIYQAVGEQIKSLGHDVIILTASDEKQYLNYAYSTFPKSIIKSAEKLTGLLIQNFRFFVSPESTYGRALRTGKGSFDHWTADAIAEALPMVLRSMAGTLVRLLKIEQSVIAPLCLDGEMFGTLTVGSSSITEADIPAIESFAAQVAISLNKARLAQLAEQELFERKQAEAKTHALLDAIPDMMFMLNREGLFIDYHASKEQLLYAPPESFLGKNIQDVMPPQMVEAYTAKLDQAIQSGKGQLFEYALDMVDGPRHFEAHIVAYQDDKILCVIRDITRRKKAEEAVEQAERHFKALIEKAPDGISLVGLDGKTKYTSPSARSMFGYDAEEDINTNPLEFIHSDDLGIVLKALNDLIEDPSYIPTVEYRYKHKDGSYHWVESTFSNLLAEPSVQAVVINFRDITERKQAEDALRLSEALLNTSQQLSKIGGWEWDVENQSVFWTNETYRIHGFVADEIRSSSMEEHKAKSTTCYEPKDRPIILAAFQRCVEQGESYDLELPFTSATGRKMWIRTTARAVWEEARIVKVIGNIMDITTQKQAEEALRTSENKFHSVVTESVDGIALLDEKGYIIEFNNAFEQITGHKREAVLGQSLWDLQLQIIPRQLRTNEYYSQLKGAIQKALETGQSPYFHKIMEVPFEHPNGSVRFIQQRLFSIRTEKGWRMGSISRDITEQKRVEEALRASEERYRVLYEDNPSMYFTADANGTVLSVNKFGIGQLGYETEELAGRSIFNVFHPDDRIFVQEQFTTCLQNLKQTIQIEARKVRKNGTMLWVRESACAVHDVHGQVVVLLTCDDITERKRAEEALRASEESFKSLYQIIRLMTDNLPDLVWAKDMDGRYIFANKATVEKLLIAQDTDEPIGKTDMYFAERQRTSHPENYDWHTFGELCVNSDGVVHASRQPERFEEFGNVKGEFLFLDVYKAPFLNEQGNMIGTVGIGRDVTHEKKLDEERKQAQDALTASEGELRALFASMQDTVLVIDREGGYRKIAPTNPGKFYVPPEEVIGKHLTDFFPADQVKKILKVMQQVLETQKTLHIEYELTFNEQSPWFEASISPMGEDRTLWVARDISERKQVEAKLNLQSAALEAAANTIVITNHNGLIEWANSSFANLTGYDPSEAIGKNPREIIKSGRQSQLFYKELWDSINSGKIWRNELVNRRKDGSFYVEEMTITPLRNLEGEISHFIAIKQDITERKQAEALLVQSEQAYRMLFENMPIGLYRTSTDGQLLDVNPALVNMFGYPDRSSMLAMKAEDLYADPGTNKNFRDKISEASMLSAFEAEFRRYDQNTFWAEDYVHIVFDKEGVPIYYEGSLINITDRKQSADNLRRANKSLETAHRELQQTLAHEQVLARTDGLTGLSNRRYFFELATREFNASIRYQRPLAIILFDVDDFKQSNDTFGHAMGDTILAQIAQAAAAQVRDVDLLARYGGDEFIILLPQTHVQEAQLIAERIRESVEITKVEADQVPLTVTISVGIAEMSRNPVDESIEHVIQRADKALYYAKQAGRNRTVIFDLASKTDLSNDAGTAD